MVESLEIENTEILKFKCDMNSRDLKENTEHTHIIIIHYSKLIGSATCWAKKSILEISQQTERFFKLSKMNLI